MQWGAAGRWAAASWGGAGRGKAAHHIHHKQPALAHAQPLCTLQLVRPHRRIWREQPPGLRRGLNQVHTTCSIIASAQLVRSLPRHGRCHGNGSPCSITAAATQWQLHRGLLPHRVVPQRLDPCSITAGQQLLCRGATSCPVLGLWPQAGGAAACQKVNPLMSVAHIGQAPTL